MCLFLFFGLYFNFGIGEPYPEAKAAQTMGNLSMKWARVYLYDKIAAYSVIVAKSPSTWGSFPKVGHS